MEENGKRLEDYTDYQRGSLIFVNDYTREMRQINTRTVKSWLYYFITVFIGIYLHEIGHCVVAWFYGKRAIPTPAKEYLLDVVSPVVQQHISLGGILGTVFFSLTLFYLYLKAPHKFPLSIYAASLASPGIYSFLFALKGRGHDATEFQEAQAAMGFSYSGHFVDYLFLVILMAGLFFWIYKSKPAIKILPTLVIGFVLTVVFIVGLQTINNRIFDPLFS